MSRIENLGRFGEFSIDAKKSGGVDRYIDKLKAEAAEQGRKEGFEEGSKQGFEHGKKEGFEEGKKQGAKQTALTAGSLALGAISVGSFVYAALDSKQMKERYEEECHMDDIRRAHNEFMAELKQKETKQHEIIERIKRLEAQQAKKTPKE